MDLWLFIGFIMQCFIAFLMVMRKSSKTMDVVDFIKESRGLDAGSAMAINYYFGYLKLVLPSSQECDSKSIRERIRDYSDKHHVRFVMEKLVILLPTSFNIPPTFEDDDIELATPLEMQQKNRGGIAGRIYRNPVYKLLKTHDYISVEGATPLLTFFEATKELKMDEEYKKEIYESFKRKLNELLWTNQLCQDMCILIEYDDLDNMGRKRKVSDILQHLISLKINVTDSATLLYRLEM